MNALVQVQNLEIGFIHADAYLPAVKNISFNIPAAKITANLIQSPNTSISDAVTQLIARIRHCSIIVRDADHIHHFSSDMDHVCAVILTRQENI